MDYSSDPVKRLTISGWLMEIESDPLHTVFGPLGYQMEQVRTRAAEFLGELNAIHPFREGNGRTQREYIRQLAARCGHRLGWAPVTRDQMYAASILSFLKGDNTGFERILHDALET